MTNICGFENIVTYTYAFMKPSKVDGTKDMTLSWAIRIVDGIHSNYVGAINKTFMYDDNTKAKAKAKALEMVINAAEKYKGL